MRQYIIFTMQMQLQSGKPSCSYKFREIITHILKTMIEATNSSQQLRKQVLNNKQVWEKEDGITLTLAVSSALIRTNSFLLCDPATSLPLVSIETSTTQKHNHMNLQNPLHKQIFSISVISYKTQRTQLRIKHTHAQKHSTGKNHLT